VDVDKITSLQDEKGGPPRQSSLVSNYPNPFVEKTYLSFKLHKKARISLKIYNVLGKEVASIIEEREYGIGKYIESFNPNSLNLSTGTYFYILNKNGEILKNKMLYIK
jgi:type IX secretion system substrate protein